MEFLESQNKQYGFFGTVALLHGREKAKDEWAVASRWVFQTLPSWSSEDIRGFLDSTYGRHLADEAHQKRGGIAEVEAERWLRSMYEYAKQVGIAAKTPALDLRLQADAELRKAEESIRKAEQISEEILRLLPPNTKDAYMSALREHAVRCINTARFFFGDD